MKNNKPTLSPDFTIEDIRKLRDYNSARHKDMSADELNRSLKFNFDEFTRQINAIRGKKSAKK